MDTGFATLPRNCTFDGHDWAILARHWYPVALCRDLDGARPVAATLLDEPLVVYRADGRTVVAGDICPHRGVPLSMGTQTPHGVACAYHGLRFGADGRCNHVPASPDRTIPERLRVATYPAVERYGLVWTCLRPDEAVPPDICPMPHWDEPAFQRITCPTIDIMGFAGRQMEGFLDVAHFAFVHAETFGDPDNAEVPPYSPKRTERGFAVDYRSTVGNYPAGATGGATGRGQAGFEWLRHFECHLPFTATLNVHFPGADRLAIMNAASPVSARVTRHDFNRRVFEEDRAIVEAQKPECLPLDPLLEAHIPADRSSMAYRRGLRDLGLSRFFTA